MTKDLGSEPQRDPWVIAALVLCWITTTIGVVVYAPRGGSGWFIMTAIAAALAILGVLRFRKLKRRR